MGSIYNIMDYGAAANNADTMTGPFQKAVAACEQAGGGTVYVPGGVYYTGPITLKSNMNLYLDAGAEIRFSDRPEDYDTVTSRWEGVQRQVYRSCIYAQDAENVSVTGHGTLNGCGSAWWALHREGKLTNPRPKLISFHNCKRVMIRDIQLINSPSWTVNPILCDGVVVSGISIRNPHDSPNTDGIDPDSCSNVQISDCLIDVGDDCIAVKSGTEQTAERVPSTNITISNCTMLHGHGGVVLGSEMSGGIRRVVISNCVFEGTDRGIRIKSRRGRGGVIEDIIARGIVMHDVLCPFTANLYYFCGPGGKEKIVWDKSAYPVNDATPTVRNLYFSDIIADGVSACAGFFYGLAECFIENVNFSNVSVSMTEDAAPGMPDMMANLEPVSRQGFFCSNIRDFTFRSVTVAHHVGPAFYMENGEAVELSMCRAKSGDGSDLSKFVHVK